MKIDYINLTKELFIKYKNYFIITDKTVYSTNKTKIDALNINNIYQISPGESSKEFNMVEELCCHLSKIKFPRQNSCIIAIGGGVVGDLAGFIASIYMRGVDFIQVPTTLLAMVDSSIGGKNGINNQYGKNLIGTIRQPNSIIIDVSFLETLPQDEFINGMAEIIKIASTSNIKLWNLLNKENLESIQSNPNLLINIIKDAIETKVSIVEKDTFEKSTNITTSRMVLNFGHTFGHAIEKLTSKKHGYCVAQGMILETDDIIVKNQIISCLSKYELPIEIDDELDITKIIEYIKCDKKGTKMVTLENIGNPKLIDINEEYIRAKLVKKVLIHRSKYIPNNKNNTVNHFIVPGSKSETNRALILSALGSGTITLINPLISDDTCHMMNALESLGIKLQKIDDKIIIEGCNGIIPLKNASKEIFIGNSGTSMRFLLPLISTCLPISNNTIKLKGDKWMNKRPINQLVDKLNENGATIEYDDNNQLPPINVHLISKFKGGKLCFNDGISSQYISGIMMTSPNAINNTEIVISKSYPSLSFIKLTYEMMRSFNIDILFQECDDKITYTIQSKQYKSPKTLEIEADATAAIYPVVYSIIHNLKVDIINLKETNKQGDYKLYNSLINHSNNVFDMDSSDTFITFAVLFAFNDDKYIIQNIANQNLKECRRIDATYKALKKCGVNIRLINNSLIINGQREYSINNKPILLDCHDDHRLVMSFAILASKMKNIVLTNYQAVEKTYPSFWKDMEKLGLTYEPYVDTNSSTNISNTNDNSNTIILIGMPNVGKTTYGKNLSKKIGYKWFDTDKEILKIIDTTIANYIKLNGWDIFRRLEYSILYDILNNNINNNIIISTGGGIVEYEESRELLKQYQYTIFLERDLSCLRKNIVHISTINELWKRREKWYMECSKYSYYIIDNILINNKILLDINYNVFSEWISKIMIKFIIKQNSTFLSLSTNKWYDIIIPNGISAIEYRYDLYPDNLKRNIFELHKLTNKPILFTDHSFNGLEYIAQRYGCTIIDIDMEKNVEISKYHNTSIIGSIHNTDIKIINHSISKYLNQNKPDLIKIVSSIKNKSELEKNISELSNHYKIMNIYKGYEGRLSRIINKYMTPVCLAESEYKTAEGQIDITELVNIRKLIYKSTDRINRYCLFGKPIGHSQSKKIHNDYFNDNNDHSYYSNYEIDNPIIAFKYFQNHKIKGASVTIPLKEEMIKYMDEISDDVTKIGALNTIIRLENGKIRGENTDWMAIYDFIIKQNIATKYILNKSVRALIIGTGGTAKSASYAINKAGYSLFVKGRSREKMNIFKERFNATTIVTTILSSNFVKMNIIVICIPGHIELDLSKETDCDIILEMAYNPIMKRVYPPKAKIIDGRQLLQQQAYYQYKLWKKNE
jgi:pentafunctional AROM polypeptide